MAKYEVTVGSQKYEIEAPDEQALNNAVQGLAQQNTPPAATQEFAGGQSGAAALGAADTASFGLGDELGAGLGAVSEKLASYVTGEQPRSYDELLNKIRDQDVRAKATNPGSYLAGQVGGGVAQGAAGLGAAGGRVVGGALANGLMGAVYGFGSGEDGLQNRATNAGIQGSIGAAVGGAFPAVSNAARNTYRGITDYMARNAAAQTAGASRGAVDEIARLLAADQSLGHRGAQNMARAGDEAMLADAGPNAMQALDTAVQYGGPASNTVRQAVTDRANRGAGDLQTVLDNTLGAPVGVETARAGIRDAARPQLAQVYDRAYSTPIDYASDVGHRIEGLVRNRVPQQAITNANNLMRVNGEQSQQILAHVDGAGNVVFERMPDVRQLDYITRGLRQMSESGEGQGALGGQTQLGASYQNLARDIRTGLREAVPEYGVALDTAADPISRSQAIKFGSTALNPSVTRDQVAREAAGMSAAERQAAAEGIRIGIDDKMARVTQALTDPNMNAREAVAGLKDLSSRSSREKVAHVIGDDAAAQLFDEVDRITTSFNLRAGIADNSKTFTRQSMNENIEAQVAPNAVQQLLTGKLIKAGQRALETVQGINPAQLQASKQGIYAEIADLLTRPANEAIPAFNAMTDSASQQALNQVRADQIARIISAGGAASYPSSVLLNNRRQQ